MRQFNSCELEFFSAVAKRSRNSVNENMSLEFGNAAVVEKIKAETLYSPLQVKSQGSINAVKQYDLLLFLET